MAFAALSNSKNRRVLLSQTSGKDRTETRIAGGVLLRGFLCMLAEGQHVQHRRSGIIRWHGWVAGHEYILHGAAKRFGPVSANRTGRRGGGLLASNPDVVRWLVWLHAAVTHRPPTPNPRARLVSAVNAASSAALNVLFDDDAAVSEERTGEGLQQSPGVGAGLKGLHVAQGWTLAADYASCGVDLPVQDNSAAQTQVRLSSARLRSQHSR